MKYDNIPNYAKTRWQRFITSFIVFVMNIPSNLLSLILFIPKAIVKIVKAIGNTFKSGYNIFKDGTITTKLSFIFLGLGNIVNKQIIKGLMFIFIESTYIFYMIFRGASDLHGLTNLGTKTAGFAKVPGRAIPIYQAGDNSMLMLIYGVLALIVTCLFIIVYISGIKCAHITQKQKQNNQHIPSFKEDVKEMFDSKFHVTLLTVPILGVLLFTILPLIFMILIAYTNYDRNHQPPGNLFTWVGLSNISGMISDPLYSRSFFPILTWTLVWAIFATFSNYFLGIILSLMINKKGIKFKKFFRTIFVLTIAIPQFISLLVMTNILNQNGPLNQLLINLHILKEGVNFLGDPFLAKVSVLVVNLWIGIPYTMLITTGILMNIPNELYEAARVEGASTFQIFKKITMPYVLFVTSPFLITQFIGNINNFNVIFLLTGGGPVTSEYYGAGKTDLLITWLYKLTVTNKDYSLASTIGIYVFIISAVVSLIAYRNTASYKREDEFK